MRLLPLSSVTDWVNSSWNCWIPRSVDTNCPFCKRTANFSLADLNMDHQRKTVAATSRCPGCGKNVFIWVVGPTASDNLNTKHCSCLAIFPANQHSHRPIEGSELIPEPLQKDYTDAIAVYNAGVWSATATLCRRTLEGLILHLNGNRSANGTLAQMLQELPEKVDLAKPITSLATSVRLGGNIGAHFDTDLVPDQEFAKTMLDLLEYLLEYFFTIPQLIERSKAILDKPRPGKS